MVERCEALDRQTVQRIRGAKDLGEEAIDALVVRIQEVHHTYGRVPFAVLERIPVIAGPAKGIEQVQQEIADGVYGAIRVANRLVGLAASRVLDQIDERIE